MVSKYIDDIHPPQSYTNLHVPRQLSLSLSQQWWHTIISCRLYLWSVQKLRNEPPLSHSHMPVQPDSHACVSDSWQPPAHPCGLTDMLVGWQEQMASSHVHVIQSDVLRKATLQHNRKVTWFAFSSHFFLNWLPWARRDQRRFDRVKRSPLIR